MREMKFRCWNGETMISPDYIDRDGSAHWKENSIPQSTDEIMQYTGLEDKNGKEICEGDILENGSTYGSNPKLITVVWNERDGAFNGKVGVSRLPLSCAHWFYGNCKVIGNIYENPELLEAEYKHY